MKAYSKAILRFERAIELEPDSIIAKYFCGISYFLQWKSEESVKIFEELYAKKDTLGDLEEPVTDYLFRSLLYKQDYNRTLELTKAWKNSKFRGITGSFRARAIKSSVEEIENVEERANGISRAIATLEDVLRNDGYIKCACIQVRNISNEIAMLFLTKKEYLQKPDSMKWLDFIVKHIPEIKDYISYPNRDCNYLIDFIEKMNSHKNKNRFTKVYWTNFVNEFKSQSKILLSNQKMTDQHIEVTVEKQITDAQGRLQKFIFAKSDDGKRFFVHQNSLKNESYLAWRELQAGSKLAIIPDWVHIPEGKDIVAKEGFILSL